MSNIQLICPDSSERLSIPLKLLTAPQTRCPPHQRQQSQELGTPAFCLRCFLRGQSSDLSLGPVYHRRGCVTKAERVEAGWVGWGDGSGACFQVVTSRTAPSQSQCPMGESTVRRTWYKKETGGLDSTERESGSFHKLRFNKRGIITKPGKPTLHIQPSPPA